jgi:hypothetical protein
MDDLVTRLRNHCFSTDWQVAVADAREAANRIEQLEAGLARYSCACSEPCVLYDAEKAREADMPHMMCGWWAKSALEGK